MYKIINKKSSKNFIFEESPFYCSPCFGLLKKRKPFKKHKNTKLEKLKN